MAELHDEQAPSPTDLMNGAEQPPYQAGTPVRPDEQAPPTTRLYGHPGAEVLDLDPATNLDRQWDWHLEVFRNTVRPGCAHPGVGLPDPLTMTVEVWTVHPPEHHLPSAPAIVEWLVEMAADNETDEGWLEDAEDAVNDASVLACARALRLAVGRGIRYRMADENIATVTVTRTAHWNDGSGSGWHTKDSEPVTVSLHAGTDDGC